MEWPKISIVTPSYNQAQFLERTICSVLDQNYPNLEYIIIDGGSTDGSLDIIRKYESRLAYWVSESDGGQSDALNKGFRLATGDIIGWLNSDDMYCHGALWNIAQLLNDNPDWQLLHGGLFIIDTKDQIVDATWPLKNDIKYTFYVGLDVHQQALFWRRDLMKKVGLIDEQLSFSMDLDFILRLLMDGIAQRAKFHLGMFRVHGTSKSALQIDQCISENSIINNRYRQFISPAIPTANSVFNKLYLRAKRLVDVLFDAPLYYVIFKLIIKLFGRSRLTDRLIMKATLR